MFQITEETPVRPAKDGILIVSGPGGSPWVTDPERPHLGGNFDGGDLGTMYPNDLWPWLIKTLEPKSMVDIGCGTGETLRFFAGLGIRSIGVEGLPWNVARCRERGTQTIILHDFQDGPVTFEPVTLGWCADVIEHIDEKFEENIFSAFKLCDWLALCHGTEANANEGWHHVNNKSEKYWVSRLAEIGMIEDEKLTKESREVGNHGWWEYTGRIYKRAA